jgi:ribosomal subunit interface protein
MSARYDRVAAGFPYFHGKGALMNISLNYKHVDLREPVEAELSRHVGKLGKLLRSYAPELVQLHGAFEKHPRKVEYAFSLNLSLPTGTLHATGEGPDLRLSVKQAFGELERQIKKHQAKLRKEYQWKRKRSGAVALL